MKTLFLKWMLFVAIVIGFPNILLANFPSDIWPQNGQTAQWTVNNSNELCFNGNLPSFGPATVATTFGGLVANDFTSLKIKFDAIVSTGGENTTIILSSNAVWGSQGVIIAINRFQITCDNNFSNNEYSLTPNSVDYQNNIILPGQLNSFIINVAADGVISVTVNGVLCSTTYNAPLATLQATTPSPRFLFIGAGFSNFRLKNLKAERLSVTKQYFTSYAPLSGTYYIDAENGSDIATGQSPSDAWRSFTNINRTILSAGTKILLRKGSVWNDRLEIRGAGTANNWITIDSYGSGVDKPKISLNNGVNDIAILITDLDKTSGVARAQSISYIKVQNLEIANTRLGIYYRCTTGTENTGFKVDNITFTNINCDAVMTAINTASNKNTEISNQLAAIKGNLETVNGTADGGVREYIFPAGVFVGGQTFGGQTISGNHTTVLTEWEVSNCQFNEAIAGIMSVFYWPISNTDGANNWLQLVHKVKVKNITSTGIVNGVLALDCVNAGAVQTPSGEMSGDNEGWGVFKNVNVTMGSAVSGRTWPNGTTGVILSSCKNFLIDSCEFSELINQNNPDGCGFDFETNTDNVTLQNSKFLNNDGHSILLMNGGNYGGNNNIIIQKNLFAKNIKNGTSTTEFLFSANSDGHTNVKVRNNQVFMRKTNKNNQNVTFLPNRSYVTASYNDLYYLDDAQLPLTISFLGQPYTYKALVNSLTAPQISNFGLKNGETSTPTRNINLVNSYSLVHGSPAEFILSEDQNFTGATWNTFNTDFPYTLSSGNGSKILYLRTRNQAGTSPVYSIGITLNENNSLPITLLDFTVSKIKDKVVIKWETVYEINNSHFTVYKANEDGVFQQFTIVGGKNSPNKYQISDLSPNVGNVYYKLTQTDKDGTVVNLGIKQIFIQSLASNTFRVYPNPATSYFLINFLNEIAGNCRIQILHLNGEVVQENVIENGKDLNNLQLALKEQLNSGMYIVKIINNNTIFFSKLLVKN